MQQTRKRELGAELSHSSERKDCAGAAAILDQIKAIEDIGITHGVSDDAASGAAVQAAHRKRKIEADINAMVARKDYAGAAKLQKQSQADVATEMIEQRRKQELDIHVENLLRRKSYEGAAVLQNQLEEEVQSGEQSRDDIEAAVAQETLLPQRRSGRNRTSRDCCT